ncbi:MAG: FAD-dependent oxidoreductase, partial [Lachnospiraceae bacterium]|nr:FAD-dependent oxidoreductase [Lachnospiraceae bacterium]
MFDSIVIGSGIAGAAAARKLAQEGNRKVLVIEKRSHIGGNCYDRKDSYGVLIHEYGPHIFHTSIEKVFQFLSQFTDWYFFGHEVAANVSGKLIPVPFNLNTLHMVYDKEKAQRLEKVLVSEYGEGSRIPIMELRKNENPEVKAIADYVYENIFLHYTMKQWGQTPEEISKEVTGRLPVV